MMKLIDGKHYNLAYLVAKSSQCRYKFGAVIAYRSNVFSVACNIIKTHPVQKRYKPHCISIHAELYAILKASGDINGATMYIARYMLNGDEGLSKPCATCLELIKESGIRQIVYMSRDGLCKDRIT